MANLVATRWLDQKSGLRIEVTNFNDDGSMLFAVRRKDGDCLNKQGGWEFEPSPSNRDAQFKERCRWIDFGQAARALDMAIEHQS